MSLKDDFLEALRSVKKDFIKDYDNANPVQPPLPQTAAEQEVAPPAPESPEPSETRASDEGWSAGPRERSSVRDNFQPDLHTPMEPGTPEKRESAYESEDFFSDLNEEESVAEADDRPLDDVPLETAVVEAVPFAQDFRQPFEADGADNEGGDGDGDGGRFSLDSFDLGESFGDERTIISKNTVIRGALQTDDSVRMFGQVLGDIDCRSNILVAGKVRGNTSAANAYVINAQVDGNLLCDDVINVTDDAWILGNIRAQQADIDGKIKGNIEIRHSISIGSNSSVIGNISTDELEIRRGAFVNGQIMMYSPSRDVIDRFDRFDQ